MGSFYQWFDRDKLKEIFRTHWNSFKEQVAAKEMRAKNDELYRKYPNGLVANIQKGQVPKRVN
jgi:hypothetical protein